MTALDQINRLRDNLDNLSPRDRAFAESLLAARSLSPKQMFWVNKLGERATGVKPPVTSIEVGGISKIVELIDRAKRHLQFPTIVMSGDKHACRVSVAGQRARVPGSITVTSAEKDAPDGRRTWYGRITPEGNFEPTNRLQAEDVTALANLLSEFAKDPAGVASRYGRLHGHCCFCRLPLKDERSTVVGYGRTCADHFGLPWGNAKHEFTAEVVNLADRRA